MTELRVRPEAEVDAFQAASWYERETEGLGSAFLAGLRRVLDRIEGRPLQFPVVAGDVRRALLARFPFAVFFFVEGEAVTVIAVLHLHRRSDTWSERR